MDTFCIISNTTETCQNYCGEHCEAALMYILLFISFTGFFICSYTCKKDKTYYNRFSMDYEEGEMSDEDLVVAGKEIHTQQPPKYER